MAAFIGFPIGGRILRTDQRARAARIASPERDGCNPCSNVRWPWSQGPEWQFGTVA
jgi:hypothetical protein